MPGTALIRSILEQASAQGKRSTALKPLGWMLALSVTATLSAFAFEHIPTWVGIFFAIVSGVGFVTYIVCYLFFMFTDIDALRSESFSIHKMAIEKGLYGDSTKGYTEIAVNEDILKLDDQSNSEQEDAR